MQLFQHKKRQRGFTFLEFAGVMALIAIAIGAIAFFYSNATQSQDINTASQDIAVVSQSIRSVYSGQTDYTGVGTDGVDAVINGGMVPKRMVNAADDGLVHVFEDTITIDEGQSAADTADNADNFSISMANVPEDACVRLAGIDMGNANTNLQIADGFYTQAAGDLPVGIDVASDKCAGGATMTWSFR